MNKKRTSHDREKKLAIRFDSSVKRMYSSIRLRKTPTLLSLATAKDTDVLKSSGLFWAREVIRLAAAVTTPWKERDNYKHFFTKAMSLSSKGNSTSCLHSCFMQEDFASMLGLANSFKHVYFMFVVYWELCFCQKHTRILLWWGWPLLQSENSAVCRVRIAHQLKNLD